MKPDPPELEDPVDPDPESPVEPAEDELFVCDKQPPIRSMPSITAAIIIPGRFIVSVMEDENQRQYYLTHLLCITVR